MSYILDALKKTEQEKARKARGNGLSGISGALFDVPPARNSAFPGWRVVVAVVVLAVVATFALTWIALRPSRPAAKAVPKPAAPVSAPAPAPAVREEAAAPPPIAAPAPVVPPPAAPKAAVPAHQSAPQPPRVKAVTAPPVPVAANVTQPSPSASQPPTKVEGARPADDAAARLTLQELGKRQLGRRLTPEQSIPPPADIALSGIAWQEERRARRAVVNGFLMQEGGIVSGARIVEIFQDRVRFGMSGKYFDLSLVSATAQVPGK